MDQKQIKDFIAQKVPEGYSLSKIQDMLKEQGVHITFMELRLLASEIEEQVWKQTEKDDAPPPAEEPAASMAQEDAMEADSVQDASEDPVPPAEPQQDAPAAPPRQNSGGTLQDRTSRRRRQRYRHIRLRGHRRMDHRSDGASGPGQGVRTARPAGHPRIPDGTPEALCRSIDFRFRRSKPPGIHRRFFYSVPDVFLSDRH